MPNEMKEDIISQVKKELGIDESQSDLNVLFDKLSDATIQSHPDKFTDKKAKEIAEERFKRLNPLREQMKAYMEQRRASGLLSVFKGDKELAALDANVKISDQALEILKLKGEIDDLKLKVQYTEGKLADANKKVDEQKTLSAESAKENLRDIYKPKKVGNTIGISALIVSLTAFVPSLQALIGSLGLFGIVGKSILWLIVLLWVLKWIRNYVCKLYIQSVIDKVLMCGNLMEELSVVMPKERYSNPYFTERSIIKMIDQLMQGKFMKVLFWGSRNTTRRMIVEYIILELECKHIIVDSRNNDMQRYFFIEHSSRDTSGLPF